MKKVLVIGGGFFGLFTANYMAANGYQVKVIEEKDEVMNKASLKNQARIHQGYHYPRSILTGIRSRRSFSRFSNDFESCIDNSFKKLYMVSSKNGNITSSQFEIFCERIKAPFKKVTSVYSDLINKNLIDEVYETVEYAFDAKLLKKEILSRLENKNVEIKVNTSAVKVSQFDKNKILVDFSYKDIKKYHEIYDLVFNCTYSKLNKINSNSNLPVYKLKHELTEIILFKPPEIIDNLGITVMCGPFFSIMPYPSKNCYSFSHVRYTPHFSWHDSDKYQSNEKIEINNNFSNWEHMVKDSSRYIPCLKGAIKFESMWEIKTVLPLSEVNDSRPILFLKNNGLFNFHSIMGAKIDNTYDLEPYLDELINENR